MTSRRGLWAAFVGAQALAAVLLVALVELALHWRISRLPTPYVESGVETPAYFNNPSSVIARDPFDLTIRYTINSAGLRGREVGRKRPGVRRALVLGDSVAFGVIVQDRDTFAEQLERLLAPAGDWELLNGASPGYDAWDYEGFLKLRGLALEPDFVIVAVYMNDNTRAATFRRPEPSHPKLARLRDLLRESRILKTLMYAAGKSFNKNSPFAFAKRVTESDRRALAGFYPGDPESAAALERFLTEYKYEASSMLLEYLPPMMDFGGWRRSGSAFRGIAAACNKRGLPVLAVVFPAQFEVYPGYRHPEPHRTVGRVLREAGFPVVDLLEPFRQGGADELFPFRSDTSHPGKEGYAIAARETLAKMRELGWLEGRRPRP